MTPENIKHNHNKNFQLILSYLLECPTHYQITSYQNGFLHVKIEIPSMIEEKEQTDE